MFVIRVEAIALRVEAIAINGLDERILRRSSCICAGNQLSAELCSQRLHLFALDKL